MDTVELSINSIKITISATALKKIRYFDDVEHIVKSTDLALTTISIPDMNSKHIHVLCQCMENRSFLVPTIDLVSHKDVLIVLKLARWLRISDDDITAGFANWTKHILWIDLWQPEYMYLVYKINENLIDFSKFFYKNDDAFIHVLSAISDVPDYNCAETYINMLYFYRTFNVAICYEGNDEFVQKMIKTHNKTRLSLWKSFLVNPHIAHMNKYFQHSVSYESSVWDCANISCIKPYNIGDNTIMDFDAAKQRLYEFTFGILEKPLNEQALDFPFENVVIAGGSIIKILSPNYDMSLAHKSDVDIFIFGIGAEKRTNVFESIINWFKSYDTRTNTPNTYYAVHGSLVSIYIKDVKRKFQIITVDCETPYDVIARFDFDYISWCYWNGTFYGLPDACIALRTSTTKVMNISRIKTERMIKTLYYGYSIVINKEIYDITELLSDPDLVQVKKYIRDLYSWFYPQTYPDLTPFEEQQHILCMINKDTYADIITNDVRTVVENIVIGGNFNSSYISQMYTKFNIGTLKDIGLPRRELTLRNDHGTIKLFTPVMKITKINVTDEGITIYLKCLDINFKNFCDQLENNVFVLYTRNNVTKYIFNQSNELKFILPRYRIDKQIMDGYSCLHTHQGAPLNIEEDLSVNDDLQIMFMIIIINRGGNDKWVLLKPLKFIKYQNFDPTKSITMRNRERSTNNEVRNLLDSNIDFDSVITYESGPDE